MFELKRPGDSHQSNRDFSEPCALSAEGQRPGPEPDRTRLFER